MADKNFVENTSDAEAKVEGVFDSDAEQLKHLGYKQQFHRSLGAFDSFASSFCAVNFISGVRVVLFVGLLAGGPLAIWTSLLINSIFICITTAILAEICSALPISGSLYLWVSVAAGLKYGRLVGFIVAWWVATAWMSLCAVVCQGIANFILSLLTVYDVGFPGGISNDNIKWRALVWIVSEGFLVLSFTVNYLPSRWYSIFFRLAMALMMLDFVLCLVWLPIGASRTYGLRTPREAFLTTYNGTGASPGWNWMLSFIFSSGVLVGFDVPGHIAEETENASTVAARSIFRSAVATVVGAFIITVLFLFCTPNLETLFSLSAPQPFVLIYSMALGHGGCVFMTLLASFAALASLSIILLASARIIFAIARDGALPFSTWVAQVTPNGLPRNAGMVVFVFTALLLCAIIPSASAFTSLVSAGVAPLIASYGLLPLLRLTMTPNAFRTTKFPLGVLAKPFYILSTIFNGLLFAVLVSPFTFPVSASSLNFGGIIFVAITIFGILSYWLIPDEKWLSHKKLQEMYAGASQVSGAG